MITRLVLFSRLYVLQCGKKKIEFEIEFKFVDVIVAEMCLQHHCKTGVLPAGENFYFSNNKRIPPCSRGTDNTALVSTKT